MKRAHNGSMILSCVVFVSLVTLIMMMQWQSQAALTELMVLRTQAIKRRLAVHALLEYGIALCKKNYTKLADKAAKQSVSLTFNHWPLGGDTYTHGRLTISYTDAFSLSAQFEQVTASCTLSRERDHKKMAYIISSWKSA